MSAPSKRIESLDVPQVKVNEHNGSFSSLHSSDRSYSPASSPRHGRKITGLKKIMPWRKKSRELLDVEDSHEVQDDHSVDPMTKKKTLMDNKRKKLETRKKRSRSVDHLLSDPPLATMFERSPQDRYSAPYGDNDPSSHSPPRSSLTDDESADADSGNENFDSVDGVDNTERLHEHRQRLRRKIEKTKDSMKKLQSSMDENLEEYLKSAKGNPDLELCKKTFEKKNLKTNANIGQLQKKLDKYQKTLKELETREQRVRSHTAKEVLRGVKTSVKENLGGVRDNVKAGISGVSKFFNSNENITDAHPFSSKSDSECYDFHGDELEQFGGYDVGKRRTPSPKNVFSEEDSYSTTSANQTSATASSPKFFENASENSIEAKLKELQEARVKLQETVDKALSNMNAIAASLQDERYKTQHLECQFNEIRSHWNDFSELHQNEIMVLRQEMERADERIETVDYRIVERVAEIDESFDTFDARISKIENLHHQQGLTVDDYLAQNTPAKAVLTKFLSVLLAILTLLFSIFTLLVHGVAPLTKTRFRLLLSSVIVVFLAFWWHNPEHHIFIYFKQHILEPFNRLFHFFANKLIRVNGGHDIQGNNTVGNITAGDNTEVT